MSSKRFLYIVGLILLLLKNMAFANSVPIISNIQIQGNKGDITITYDLLDQEHHPCAVTMFYQGGLAGKTWTQATVSGQIKGVHSGEGKTLVWHSGIDEAQHKASDYQIKLLANDNCNAENTKPEISNVEVHGKSGDLKIEFELTDWENDPCSIMMYYQGGSAGDSWQEATCSGHTQNIPPGKNKKIYWHSLEDEPSMNATDYQVKLVAHNACDNFLNSRPQIQKIDFSPSVYADSSVIFSWNATDANGSVAGYYVGIDDNRRSYTKSNRKLYNNLSVGSHTLYLQAQDDQGLLSDVASKTIDVQEKPDDDSIDHGQLLLVLGGPLNEYDKLWYNLSPVADNIHDMFIKRGFSEDEIYYMRHNLQNAHPGVDDTSPSILDIESALTTWASESDSSGPFFIFLLDHGNSSGVFYLAEKEPSLTAAQLNSLVEAFIEQTGRTVVIVMESCFSGKFLEKIQGSNIAFVSSSSAEKESWFTDANSFSKIYSQMLDFGFTFKKSFDLTRQELYKIKGPIASQDPQISDPSNLLSTLYVVDDSVSMSAVQPMIPSLTVSSSEIAGGEPVIIKAEVAGDVENISHVRATVLPPDFVPKPVKDKNDYAELTLPRLNLLKSGPTTYEAEYKEFSQKGEYSVHAVALNEKGDVGVSETKKVKVTAGIQPSQFTKKLTVGWNLAALPIEPQSPQIATLLEPVKEHVSSVWKWKGSTWAVYLPDGNTASYAKSKGFEVLTNLSAGEGFWIHMNQAETFATNGTVIDDSSLELSTGWNLVGLKQCGPFLSTDELLKMVQGPVSSIWKWDDQNWSVSLPGENTESYVKAKGFAEILSITPGEGVWIKK